MPKLSVTIITNNEEKNIGLCLESVSFADEIIVVDSHSSDNTRSIAEQHGARVFIRDWKGYGPAKREAVKLASGEWILSLDADEALSPKLQLDIKQALDGDSEFTGFYLKRKTQFLGRWIMHCGWYPDLVLRLFRKDKGNFNDSLIHEGVELDGRAGTLDGEILHYCYQSMEQYLEKSNRYTSIGAREAYKAGKRAGWFDLTVRPVFSFFNHYILKSGYLDGTEGLILSALSAQAVLHKYSKIRQIQRGLVSGDDIA